jgi:transposase
LNLNNKPTLRQRHKLLNEQLKTTLEENQGLKAYAAGVNEQNRSLVNQVDFLQRHSMDLLTEIGSLKQAAAEKDTTITLLHQSNHNLSELVEMKDTLLSGAQQTIDKQLQQLAAKDKELEEMALVRHERHLLVKQVYCPKSEKSHEPAFLPELIAPGFTPEEWADAKKQFARHGKVEIVKSTPGILDQGLPVRRVDVKPDIIPEGHICVGTKKVRSLIHHKEWFEVLETVYHVYMEEDKETLKHKEVSLRLLNARPLKCMADISLIVQLLMDKFIYHSPLKRQLERFKHNGLQLAYNTANDWTNKTIRRLGPLYQLMLREAIKGGYLHCDETGFLVIDKSKEHGRKAHRGYMWVMVNPLQRFACFRYAKGRGHEDIREMLEGFKGFLHTDGYSTYNKYGNQPDVKHGKCMVHCRRYFVNSKDTHLKKAYYVLKTFINPLYAIERKCIEDDLDFDEITKIRQKYSVPILEAFHKWILENKDKIKVNTPLGKAIQYTLKIWDGLMLYTTDGMLLIDNSIAERQIRGLALGRKNYMFAGSQDAAPNAAIMYTFFGTCQLQGIDAEAWLTYVLNNIDTYPKDKLADLLPQNWKHRLANKQAA